MAREVESGRRCGFNLVELLVVISVIGLLLALLLPAVQRVRESANRVRCGNNLSNIALAFHVFHHDYGIFPTGGAGFVRTMLQDQPAAPPDQDWGWPYQILPYVEQAALHAVPGVGYSSSVDTNNPISSTPVAIYFCPSRRRPGLKTDGRAGIDYFGNGGTNGPFTVPGQSEAYVNPALGDWSATGMIIRSGPSYLRRAISWESGVIDGASNTLLIAEKSFHLGEVNGSPCCYDNESYIGGWHNRNWPDTVGTAALAPAPDARETPPTAAYPNNNGILYRFGSAHPSSMNVALVDRAVRRLRYTVSLPHLQSLAVRDDGGLLNGHEIE
ncbi:MAG: DUF1559 domain-containing protein [Gemmatales bacterium]|nr:DUF1559 domain-containing protein [Gemmatales bacterium]MDW8223461.1 DUF1559 domain-containing protein [Gemmatales bacterium]